jgi:hypothetical protein
VAHSNAIVADLASVTQGHLAVHAEGLRFLRVIGMTQLTGRRCSRCGLICEDNVTVLKGGVHDHTADGTRVIGGGADVNWMFGGLGSRHSVPADQVQVAGRIVFAVEHWEFEQPGMSKRPTVGISCKNF